MEPVMNFKPFCDYFASWMPPGITDKDYVIAQYDGEMAYMDACIQNIFHALEALGILDDTIVVINSRPRRDALRPRLLFRPPRPVRRDPARAADHPLPGKVPAGKRVRATTSMKDLVPTLLELMPGSSTGHHLRRREPDARWCAARRRFARASSTSPSAPGCASTAGAPRSGS
jgi:hypothetical protein